VRSRGDRLIDGKHLGRSELRTSSRGFGGRGPQPSRSNRESEASGGRTSAILHRVFGERGENATRCLPPPGAPAASMFARGAQHPSCEASLRWCCGLTTRGARADRVGVKPPSCCPKGWFEAREFRRARKLVSNRRKTYRPWPVNPRLATVRRSVRFRLHASASGAARYLANAGQVPRA